MKVTKHVLAVLLFAVSTFGCGHAQMPPTAHGVALSWKAVTTGGQPPYVYVMSRAAATGSTCPTPNLTTPNYAPLNSTSPVSAITYSDTTATGTVCYIVQALDSEIPTPAVSTPSNVAGPFTVPTNPSQPQQLGGSTTWTSLDQPQPALPKATDGVPVVATLRGEVR